MNRQISLRLPDEILSQLDRRAQRVRKSRSDLIRVILEEHIRGPFRAPDHPYARVRDLLGSATGGPADLGARHRQYLVESIRDRRR